MFVAPGTTPGLGQKLTRDIAERVARSWSVLLLNGMLLVVAGVLIFSIDWSIRSLATFIGVLFIVQGLAGAMIAGIDARAQRVNAVGGALSAAAGVAIIVWPGPGVLAVGIFLGAWLIVMGTFAITAAFAARRILPQWWLVLILGLLEVPLGVLALADPGATLAAIVTVGGIWAVAIGVMRIVLALEVRRLPEELDKAWGEPANGAAGTAPPRVAAGR
ncbi:MAG TPA: DUF308 domain-containing protein [Solirubrobacteraceae bacterium]